jgi:hypothetical protein
MPNPQKPASTKPQRGNIVPHQILKFTFLPFIIIILSACATHVPPATTPAGEPETAKARMLEKGAEMLQPETPINAVAIYLDAFHFHNGNMEQQVEAHHYCTQLNEDFTQCILYSGNGNDALLMGIEYVISKRLFETLSMEERKLWHSHHYEVKSGQLIAPGLPQVAQHELMQKLVSTYGKTWHTWRMDHADSQLPLGYPELMMGFTADGQADPDMVSSRDRAFDVSTEANKKAREDIPMPDVVPGANAWENGEVLQLELMEMPPAAQRLPGVKGNQ